MKFMPLELALESGPSCDATPLHSHLGLNLTLGALVHSIVFQ